MFEVGINEQQIQRKRHGVPESPVYFLHLGMGGNGGAPRSFFVEPKRHTQCKNGEVLTPMESQYTGSKRNNAANDKRGKNRTPVVVLFVPLLIPIHVNAMCGLNLSCIYRNFNILHIILG